MRADRKRVVGAIGFAVFCTVMFSLSQLLKDGSVDITGLGGALLAAGLVGYLAWPGLADVWGRRDKREDGKRFLLMGLGLAAGFALSQVVSVLAGEEATAWSVGLWAGTLVVMFAVAFLQVHKARRP